MVKTQVKKVKSKKNRMSNQGGEEYHIEVVIKHKNTNRLGNSWGATPSLPNPFQQQANAKIFNENIYFTLYLGYFLDTLESTNYLFVLNWILVFNAPLPEKK